MKYLIPKDATDPVEKIRGALIPIGGHSYATLGGGFVYILDDEAVSHFEETDELPATSWYRGWFYVDEKAMLHPALISPVRWNCWARVAVSTEYLSSRAGSVLLSVLGFELRENRVYRDPRSENWKYASPAPDEPEWALEGWDKPLEQHIEGWHVLEDLCLVEAEKWRLDMMQAVAVHISSGRTGFSALLDALEEDGFSVNVAFDMIGEMQEHGLIELD